MNTWQALKKIIRDQFFRPAPEPWDGKHELRSVRYAEYAAWPDDFETGWVWQCTCGGGNNTLWSRFWPATEEGAVAQFKTHRDLHRDLEERL